MNTAPEYKLLLIDIKRKVREAQIKTVVAANSQMLLLYWQLGNYILENQGKEGWGAKIVDRLSADLSSEFPNVKGFSCRNLKYMRKFAELYPPFILNQFIEGEHNIKSDISKVQHVVALLKSINKEPFEIVQQPAAQFQETYFHGSIVSRLGWTHHLILMDKVKNYGELFWYMLNTWENGVGRNTLAMQIETRLFERQIEKSKVTNFESTLPAPHTDFANYILKDPYIFDFVQAKEKADERDIEQQLVDHITKFLLELGQGFAYIGRQVHFDIGGSDFYIDLLFYHTKLHSYVVVELKARDFEPGDAGQLNFYINLVNDKLKGATDNDTIGILLCKGKNEILAEYALKNISQPIGVADYVLSKAIPENLKSQLPDIDELENSLSLEL